MKVGISANNSNRRFSDVWRCFCLWITKFQGLAKTKYGESERVWRRTGVGDHSGSSGVFVVRARVLSCGLFLSVALLCAVSVERRHRGLHRYWKGCENLQPALSFPIFFERVQLNGAIHLLYSIGSHLCGFGKRNITAMVMKLSGGIQNDEVSRRPSLFYPQ
jgi:hypothetical protein